MNTVRENSVAVLETIIQRTIRMKFFTRQNKVKKSWHQVTA